ncbi:MAG: four helix bundle protein [Chitinophagaceae bacterium]|nr:four helix bundle protein [Chitinophagaceae bacterium]
MNSKDLQQRLKNFAIRLVPLCEVLPAKRISKIIEDQLLRSGFSAAANYRAACNAQSKKAFNAKLSIALEEIDEASFWLEMIAGLELVKHEKLSLILMEANELTRILGASRRTVARNLKIDN